MPIRELGAAELALELHAAFMAEAVALPICDHAIYIQDLQRREGALSECVCGGSVGGSHGVSGQQELVT